MENKSVIHKELKKQVAAQLETALLNLKELLGDKKFANRIKKAAKLITDGIGKEKKESPVAPAAVKALKAPVAKKVVAPKAVVKRKAPVAAKVVKAAKAPVVKKKVISSKK